MKQVRKKPFNPESLRTEIKGAEHSRCFALKAVQYLIQLAKVDGWCHYFLPKSPHEIITHIIIFKLVKFSSRSEVIHSGESQKLKNNSVLGRLHD